MIWIHIVRYAFLHTTFVYRIYMIINMCTNAETNMCQWEMQGGRKNNTLLGCRSDPEEVICTAVRNFIFNLSFTNLLTLLNLFA